MSFWYAYKESMMSDYVSHGGYFDNDALRKAASIEEYTAAFTASLTSLHNWAKAKVTEMESVAATLKKKGDQADVDCKKLQEESLALTHEVLRFCEARNLNEDAVREALKECTASRDAVTSDKCSSLWLKQYPFHKVDIDELLLAINRLYAVARRDKQLQEEKLPGSEGSQSFERRSIKFWVHPQDFAYVYLTVSRHLPVDTDRSDITSIYYDTPDLQLYHQRMERTEGSFLIRIRWYGDKDKDVFIERKVHHEAWIGDMSTKQRFSIAEKHVNAFRKGSWDVKAAIEALNKKGAKASEIRNFSSLVQDVLTRFQSYDLHPMLRSKYNRTAFQFANSAAVRVSIDTNMFLSRERTPDNNWRQTSPIPDSDKIVFPYSVCEVKLQLKSGQELPGWVTNLMQHSLHMESIPKFSKYGHGICALYGERAKYEPYWLHQINNDIRAATKVERGFDVRVGVMEGCVSPLVDECLFGECNRYDHIWEFSLDESRALTQKYFALSGDTSAIPTVCHHSVRSKAYRRNGIAQGARDLQCSCTTCTTAEHDALNGNGQDKMNGMIPWQTGKAIRVPKKTDPKTFITSERYLLHWVSMCVGLAFSGIIALTLGERAFGLASHFARLGGLIALLLSCLIMMYTLVVYRVRTNRMYSKNVMRYDDTCGPVVLAVAMMLMIVLMASVPLYNMVMGSMSLTPILQA